jgi:hypothetical protein
VKGDFSRLTFRPQQHYSRVLQQQGRPHLDADWNEQVAVLLHRLETLTGDLLGDAGSRSGAPVGMAGFEIGPVAGEADNFTIGRGRYYVDGLCCECEQDTTYVAQPLPTGTKPERNGISLVYLDAWEAVVGPLDDPLLLEPALSGLETTLRARIVWQVRTQRLSQQDEINAAALAALRAESDKLVAGWRSHRRGLMRVRLSSPPAEAGHRPAVTARGGHFRGPENLLYRIEVHDGGPVGQATFKWSRENGSVLLPLTSVEGNIAHVAHAGRRAASQLTLGTWLELSDSLDRALGRTRPMVAVSGVDGTSGRIEFTAAPGEGQDFKPGERADMALRRWDQRSIPGPHGGEVGPKGMPIIEGEHEAHWLDIEDAIQIQFEAEPKNGHRYRAGDYWLVPARTADEGIVLRSHEAQPPDGVEHHYAPLGLFVPQTAKVVADYRQTFRPLAALQEQVNTLSTEVEGLKSQIATLLRR